MAVTGVESSHVNDCILCDAKLIHFLFSFLYFTIVVIIVSPNKICYVVCVEVLGHSDIQTLFCFFYYVLSHLNQYNSAEELFVG